jgi:hypothetical protein
VKRRHVDVFSEKLNGHNIDKNIRKLALRLSSDIREAKVYNNFQ